MRDYKLIRSKRKTLAIEITKECELVVRAPMKLSVKDIEHFLAEREQWIENALKRQQARRFSRKEYTDGEIEFLRRKAREVIPPKVEYYSHIMGVEATAIRITSAKTRYGSCSGKNSLNFSLYLMDKDERAIDYVVVHELAHIKEHNHSKAFYAVIASVMPDYKEREKLLKQ